MYFIRFNLYTDFMILIYINLFQYLSLSLLVPTVFTDIVILQKVQQNLGWFFHSMPFLAILLPGMTLPLFSQSPWQPAAQLLIFRDQHSNLNSKPTAKQCCLSQNTF